MSGVLILVVGPSGAGKDTLIGGAAEALRDDPRFVFPRRIITRPQDAGGEPHIAQSPEAFAEAEKAGAFALSWRAHDLAYGIPGSIRADLRAGRHVVVNVSRSVIDQARQRFPGVQVIAVSVPREVLAQRLTARGREDAADIARRLERAQGFRLEGSDIHALGNDGPLEQGNARMVALLRSLTTGLCLT
jgi:ribose 1,5-bisphosphokinase